MEVRKPVSARAVVVAQEVVDTIRLALVFLAAGLAGAAIFHLLVGQWLA